MSSEEQFWYSIWRTVIATITLLIIFGLMYYSHKNNLMADMVKHGADPVRVMCAFDGGSQSDRILCAGYLKNGN